MAGETNNSCNVPTAADVQTAWIEAAQAELDLGRVRRDVERLKDRVLLEHTHIPRQEQVFAHLQKRISEAEAQVVIARSKALATETAARSAGFSTVTMHVVPAGHGGRLTSYWALKRVAEIYPTAVSPEMRGDLQLRGWVPPIKTEPENRIRDKKTDGTNNSRKNESGSSHSGLEKSTRIIGNRPPSKNQIARKIRNASEGAWDRVDRAYLELEAAENALKGHEKIVKHIAKHSTGNDPIVSRLQISVNRAKHKLDTALSDAIKIESYGYTTTKMGVDPVANKRGRWKTQNPNNKGPNGSSKTTDEALAEARWRRYPSTKDGGPRTPYNVRMERWGIPAPTPDPNGGPGGSGGPKGGTPAPVPTAPTGSGDSNPPVAKQIEQPAGQNSEKDNGGTSSSANTQAAGSKPTDVNKDGSKPVSAERSGQLPSGEGKADNSAATKDTQAAGGKPTDVNKNDGKPVDVSKDGSKPVGAEHPGQPPSNEGRTDESQAAAKPSKKTEGEASNGNPKIDKDVKPETNKAAGPKTDGEKSAQGIPPGSGKSTRSTRINVAKIGAKAMKPGMAAVGFVGELVTVSVAAPKGGEKVAVRAYLNQVGSDKLGLTKRVAQMLPYGGHAVAVVEHAYRTGVTLASLQSGEINRSESVRRQADSQMQLYKDWSMATGVIDSMKQGARNTRMLYQKLYGQDLPGYQRAIDVVDGARNYVQEKASKVADSSTKGVREVHNKIMIHPATNIGRAVIEGVKNVGQAVMNKQIADGVMEGVKALVAGDSSTAKVALDKTKIAVVNSAQQVGIATSKTVDKIQVAVNSGVKEAKVAYNQVKNELNTGVDKVTKELKDQLQAARQKLDSAKSFGAKLFS